MSRINPTQRFPNGGFPAPAIEEHNGILIVRDDYLPGGTKRRVIGPMIADAREVVYASPAYGYAQVALAYACRDIGIQATVFTAKRKQYHARTIEARDAGAKIVGVPHGYLAVVQKAARDYAAQRSAMLLPFGFDTDEFRDGLASIARSLSISPREIWSVAGSGTLNRALQQAWPQARSFAVKVGRPPDVGRATQFDAPEPFERDAKIRPPFPSTSNFDAKAWQFITRHASKGALFWNVAA